MSRSDKGSLAPSILEIFGPLIPQWLRRQRRQQQRVEKRETKHASFHPNGKREVARRQRQIARGQLSGVRMSRNFGMNVQANLGGKEHSPARHRANTQRDPYPLPARSIRQEPNPFISKRDEATAEGALLRIVFGLFAALMIAAFAVISFCS